MSGDADLNLVWLDIEYTNADALCASRMIQVAMLITDQELRPLWPGRQRTGIRRLMRVSDVDARNASDYVKKKQSGILEKAVSHGKDIRSVELELVKYLKSKCRSANSSPQSKSSNPMLAGQTVHMDYLHVLQQMPELGSLLNFRTVDNRTLQELAKRWTSVEKFPPKSKQSPPSLQHCQRLAAELPRFKEKAYRYPTGGQLRKLGGNHDALFDVYRGIATLNYYRKKLFQA